MSKKDEALKLALEALEEVNYDQAYATEIAAIREALAEQPVQQQEPVAWVLEWTFNGEERGRRLYDDETHCVFDAENDGGVCRPLVYGDTSPPASKPLTDEEILDCWKQVYEPGRREHDNAARMARAIEAAHGIKGET